MNTETCRQAWNPETTMDTPNYLCGMLPKYVTLTEVGPRDGFQFEKKIVPTELKHEMIMRLVNAGFKHIQVTSFVHPGKVPQMADAEKLLAELPRISGVSFSALVLNMTGVERAIASGLTHIEVSISASNRHSLNNTGMNTESALKTGVEMVAFSKRHGLQVRASIQCAFGSGYDETISENMITAMAEALIAAGADTLSLADTTGLATPISVCRRVNAVKSIAGELPIALHLHDTRGLGLANVLTALGCGIDRFDTALAGMGGCPFIPDAAGNIATEDTLYLLNSLHVETGLNLSQIASCSRDLDAFFEKPFPGKLYRLSV